jgi:hypothetical protein
MRSKVTDASVHPERNEYVLVWDVNPMHGLPTRKLLRAGVNDQAIRPKLVWANKRVFHTCSKVEGFIANDNERFLEVGVINCGTAICNRHIIDSTEVTMESSNGDNSLRLLDHPECLPATDGIRP